MQADDDDEELDRLLAEAVRTIAAVVGGLGGMLVQPRAAYINGRAVWVVRCPGGGRHVHVHCGRCMRDVTPDAIPHTFDDVRHEVEAHVCGYAAPAGKEGCRPN